MRRSLFGRKKAKRKPRLEIIPMIDVMFLLLVFYILSSIGLTVERGIPVSLPNAVSGEATAVEETMVTIKPDGKVFLNHDEVALEELGEAVEKLASELPGGLKHLQDGYVVINADMEVSHRVVVKVMDQLRQVSITNFSIATEEDS